MGSNCSCVVDKKKLNRMVKIARVDFNESENSKEHRTDKFADSENHLIVRRGQEFKVTLIFDRLFDPQNYFIVMVFTTGRDPKYTNGTAIRLEVKKLKDWKSNEWSSWTEDSVLPVSYLDVFISTSSNAIVADWKLEFQIFQINGENDVPLTSFSVQNDIFVLFNPWCYSDSVYVKDEAKLEEYILNDVGKIWRGVNTSFRGMVWNYGQFEPGILDACMKIFDHSPRLKRSNRGDPVLVCREASAMVNSNDGDNGIVVGNWSGDYENGKAPTEWQGSVELIRQWISSDKTPVKYGQCWVFTGVLNTMLRAIGIPSRAITNFESAHDTDATMTHDIHVDLEGNRVEDESYDSIWNYHVWNEVWMARPDLPNGYGGWQVVDATPQETSQNSGVFQTGPASVTAVRKGEVNLKYDTAFVFAEVNADKVVWLSRGKDEPLEVVNMETNSIGQFISTKRPGTVQMGNRDRRDVTHRYKASEMTLEERMTVAHAVGTGRSPARNIYHKSEKRDVNGQVLVEKTPWIGEDFKIAIKLSNSSLEERTVSAVIKLQSMLYTGAIHKLIKNQRNQITVSPNDEKEFQVTVRSREYLDKLIDQASLLATVLFIVSETEQVISAEHHFRVKLPDIELLVPDTIPANESSQVIAQFINPLAINLTRGKITIEGPGISEPIKTSLDNDVPPQGKMEVAMTVKPRKSGESILLANFCCKELRDVVGSKSVYVE